MNYAIHTIKILILYIVIYILFPFNVYSQLLPGETDTDFKDRQKGNSGFKERFFLGLTGKAASMIDKWGIEFGLRMGYTLTNNLSIGAGYYSVISHNVYIKTLQSNTGRPFLRLTYGGPEIEYYFHFSEELNISAIGILALGNINYSETANVDLPSELGSNWIFLAEPSIGINYNLFTGIWVSLHGGYRIASGVDFVGLKNSDLSGPVIQLTLRSIN